MTRKLCCPIVIICLASQPLSAEESFQIQGDVVYGHKDGLAMTMDVITPTENANGAAVLFMMSGGWFSRWFPPQLIVRQNPSSKNHFERLVEAGYTLCLVRHGSAPRYKVPDAVSDVRRAVRFVRHRSEEFDIDPERIGVCGGSAGGHLSLMLGTTPDEGNAKHIDPVERVGNRVTAVVAYFAPVDLTKLVGPSKSFPALDFEVEKVESVSPVLHVTEDDAPTLLVHGDKDTLVPLIHSERMHEAFKEADVTSKLIVLVGAGHGFRGESEQRATTALLEWFAKHLAPKKSDVQKTDPTRSDDGDQ